MSVLFFISLDYIFINYSMRKTFVTCIKKILHTYRLILTTCDLVLWHLATTKLSVFGFLCCSYDQVF